MSIPSNFPSYGAWAGYQIGQRKVGLANLNVSDVALQDNAQQYKTNVKHYGNESWRGLTNQAPTNPNQLSAQDFSTEVKVPSADAAQFMASSIPPNVYDINQDGQIGGYENAALTWAQDENKDGVVTPVEQGRLFDMYLDDLGTANPYGRVKAELAKAAQESGFVQVGQTYLD